MSDNLSPAAEDAASYLGTFMRPDDTVALAAILKALDNMDSPQAQALLDLAGLMKRHSRFQ